jgi:hypothetical protein
MEKNIKFVGTLKGSEKGFADSEKSFVAPVETLFNGQPLTGNAQLGMELPGCKSKNITFNTMLEKEVKGVNFIKTVSFQSKTGKEYKYTLVNQYKWGKKKNGAEGYVKEAKEAGFIYAVDEKGAVAKMIGSWMSANTVINQLMIMTGKTYQACDGIYKSATVDRVSKNSTANRVVVEVQATEW